MSDATFMRRADAVAHTRPGSLRRSSYGRQSCQRCRKHRRPHRCCRRRAIGDSRRRSGHVGNGSGSGGCTRGKLTLCKDLVLSQRQHEVVHGSAGLVGDVLGEPRRDSSRMRSVVQVRYSQCGAVNDNTVGPGTHRDGGLRGMATSHLSTPCITRALRRPFFSLVPVATIRTPIAKAAPKHNTVGFCDTCNTTTVDNTPPGSVSRQTVKRAGFHSRYDKPTSSSHATPPNAHTHRQDAARQRTRQPCDAPPRATLLTAAASCRAACRNRATLLLCMFENTCPLPPRSTVRRHSSQYTNGMGARLVGHSARCWKDGLPIGIAATCCTLRPAGSAAQNTGQPQRQGLSTRQRTVVFRECAQWKTRGGGQSAVH